MDRDFPRLGRWACALIAAAVCCHPAWAAGPTVAFHIPAGYAPQTLREFYLQSQVRVLYLADTVKGVQTQGISGKLVASEALAQMLQGTGLIYEFEDEYSAVITRAPDAVATSHSATTPEAPGEGPSVPVPPTSKVEEVLVTGSFIHGVFDITSPLIPIERDEMKRTAYATVQDAVWALPMAGTVTQSEIFGGNGNINRGTGINLRGLSDSATLVLVNGRRQPSAGMDADFVDVSNIPWSMVDRIEVMPDGSSALYGSDAIAGVVNILLRRDIEGAETQLRYGTAADGAAEFILAQLVGHDWRTGKWLAGYQYSDRTSLAAAERDYVVNADKRSLGGRDFRSLESIPGNILNPQTLLPAFAIPRGQDGRSLMPDDLLPDVVNYRNTFANADLIPDRKMHSVYITVSQDLSEHSELFAEGRFSQRDIHLRPMSSVEALAPLRVPATNPFFVDPFGESPFLLVAYDLTGDLDGNRGGGRTQNFFGTVGVKTEFDREWQTAFSSSYGAEKLQWEAGAINPFALDAALSDPDPATAFNPFGDGSNTTESTIEDILSVGHLMAKSEIYSIQFMADGPLFTTPSGVTRAAVGLEYREETLDRESRFDGWDEAGDRAQFGRKVAAVFTEFSVPLMGNPGDSLAPPRLELSLAGRYERYNDFGSTYNPKIGIRWSPIKSIKLRTSWGTSFQAPPLVDLEGRSGPGLVSLRDPHSPTGRSNVLVLQGSNPDLREERATTWTAGVDLAPPLAPGLRLSLTGYSIRYEDQVIQPGLLSPLDILLHEEDWAAVITRNPPQDRIDAICADPSFFGDASQCVINPPAVLLDARKHNLAITRMKGIDLTLEQSLDTRFGLFNIRLNGSRVFHFKRALTQKAPVIDIVDTVNNPLALRLRGVIEWHQRGPQQHGLGISFTANYGDSYLDRDSPTRRSVEGSTTIDLGLSYQTGRRGEWTDDTELVLNVSNALDDDPPFVDRELGYDVTNALPVGRVLSAYVSKRW